MNAPILLTDRSILLPFVREDLSLFLQLNTDPFVRQYLWDDEIISQQQADEILEQNMSYFKGDDFGLWKIVDKHSNAVLGYTGLWYFFEESQPQLIYILREIHTGRGLATECAGRIMRYAFERLGFSHLVAAMDESHHASQRVAERLGMQQVEKRLENGKPTLIYRIDKSDQ
ncbi:MAG: GNAT family N-acetyltransferase [Bacteroidota bacterium]